jgi:hypothetical protein
MAMLIDDWVWEDFWVERHFVGPRMSSSYFSFLLIYLHMKIRNSGGQIRLNVITSITIKELVCKLKIKNIILLERNMLGWHGLDSSGSEQGQKTSSCKHGNKSSGSIRFRNLNSLGTDSFSRRCLHHGVNWLMLFFCYACPSNVSLITLFNLQ